MQSCATAYTECGNCSDSHLLRDNQKQLCNNHGNTELLRAIAQGVRESISDCKRQFGSEKWDCAILEGDHLFGLFTESGMCKPMKRVSWYVIFKNEARHTGYVLYRMHGPGMC